MIPKGTIVHLATTNGGEITGALVENYRVTYDAVIAVAGGYATIPSWRIKSVRAVAQTYADYCESTPGEAAAEIAAERAVSREYDGEAFDEMVRDDLMGRS